VKVEVAARASLALLLTRRIEPITFQQERDRPRSDNRPRPPLSQRIDPVVLALLSVLVLFRLLAEGWRQPDLAEPLAGLLGVSPSFLTAGRLTYQLRRLRLRGLIARQPGTHRYRVTEHGLRLALFFTRTHARLFRPSLALVMSEAARDDGRPRRAFEQLERAMDQWCAEAKLAA